ncbi:MAG: thermonuclease family protein [Chitinophagales bacterium]
MKKSIQSVLFIALFVLQFTAVFAQKQNGVIAKVTDGDSFEIIANGEKFKVRLNGIDCPEYDQAYGAEATEFAMQFLYQEIKFESFGEDKYKRVIADIYFGEKSINALLVENGYAWHYKKY